MSLQKKENKAHEPLTLYVSGAQNSTVSWFSGYMSTLIITFLDWILILWNKFRIHAKSHKKDNDQSYIKKITPYPIFTTIFSSWHHPGQHVGINQNVSSSHAGNSDLWIMTDGSFPGTGKLSPREAEHLTGAESMHKAEQLVSNRIASVLSR